MSCQNSTGKKLSKGILLSILGLKHVFQKICLKKGKVEARASFQTQFLIHDFLELETRKTIHNSLTVTLFPF